MLETFFRIILAPGSGGGQQLFFSSSPTCTVRMYCPHVLSACTVSTSVMCRSVRVFATPDHAASCHCHTMPLSVDDSGAGWTGVCCILHPSAGGRCAFCSTWVACQGKSPFQVALSSVDDSDAGWSFATVIRRESLHLSDAGGRRLCVQHSTWVACLSRAWRGAEAGRGKVAQAPTLLLFKKVKVAIYHSALS